MYILHTYVYYTCILYTGVYIYIYYTFILVREFHKFNFREKKNHNLWLRVIKWGGKHHGSVAEPIGRCLLWAAAAAAQRGQPAEGNGTAHKLPGQYISTQALKIPSNYSPGLRESWHSSSTQVQTFKSLPYNWVPSFPTSGLTAAWWNTPHSVLVYCQYLFKLQSSTRLEHEDVF